MLKVLTGLSDHLWKVCGVVCCLCTHLLWVCGVCALTCCGSVVVDVVVNVVLGNVAVDVVGVEKGALDDAIEEG